VGLFDFLKGPSPEELAQRAEAERRQADILNALSSGSVPNCVRERLDGVRSRKLPWTATLTPAELLIARSHGLKPIAAVAASCWLHYGWSWTEGHAQGWDMALQRLRDEAVAAGANAVLDVKMRTIPLQIDTSMDYTLIGTAVYVEGLPPSKEPIVATVPALEFVKLLEADVVPTGIAIGAHYEWLMYNSAMPWSWRDPNMAWMGNIEARQFSDLWNLVRDRAHAQLRTHARSQGNGVLAHLNFSQMFEDEDPNNEGKKRYLARHIVVATTVDAKRGVPLSHGITPVVDIHAGTSPLKPAGRHHESYENESEGAI
jgi:hypothetical protein